MICILLGLIVAGVQLGRHADHFSQDPPTLEDLQRQNGNLRRNYWGTNGR